MGVHVLSVHLSEMFGHLFLVKLLVGLDLGLFCSLLSLFSPSSCSFLVSPVFLSSLDYLKFFMILFALLMFNAIIT